MKDEDILNSYELWLKMKKYKKRGIEEKLRSCGYFLEYLRENGLKLDCFTVRKAEGYREYLAVSKKEDGQPRFNPATINSMLAELKLFFKYLVCEGIAVNNPFEGIERMRESMRLPKNILNIQETGLLLHGISVNSFTDFKFKVVVELLYSTGCRISEAEGLRKRDIDLVKGIILIRYDKDKKDRLAPLTEYTVNILQEYLAHFKDNDYVFAHGKPRSLNRFINDRLKKLCEKLELPPVTCHTFRHTVASQLLKKGADIREVQEILGHERVHNTEVYTRLMTDDLKDLIHNLHPRERGDL